MTLEEAKKILEKEGFYFKKATRPCAISEAFTEYEDPSICKAMQVVSSAGYFIYMEMSCFDERKARLKKEHEKHANAPVSGKEKAKKGNPALEEAASQFNDALLDEHGKKIKHLTKKISRLNKIIHKKNEELRLTKIREKNLAELGLKYVGENEKLKKKLADKIVNEIDARALKSSESALAYKEKQLAEKDEVIADLGKELAATKKELEEKTKLVGIIRNASKEYCVYGVAANEFIKKLAKLYVLVNNNGTINNEMLERCKNYQTYGFPANCNRETKKEINDIASGKENEKLSLFRDDSVGAVTNQKDCSPVKDTHPTEDNPEEIEIEKAVKLVRKAMKEGHTVSISHDKAEEGGDHSGKIVLCGKDFVKILKENEKAAEELSKVLDDVIDQFLLFGEIIIKEEK